MLGEGGSVSGPMENGGYHILWTSYMEFETSKLVSRTIPRIQKNIMNPDVRTF
jgi:hypothetical protein